MLGKTCLMGELIYDNETAVYYTPHLTLSFHHKMQTRSLRTTNLSPGWLAGSAVSAGRPVMWPALIVEICMILLLQGLEVNFYKKMQFQFYALSD